MRLFDGVPQQREAEAGAWRYFRFSVNPNGTTAFTVSVSPSLGNPDLFITSDGVLPSRTHFGWHADAVGEDAVTVDAHDAGWCTNTSCTYLIGVSSAFAAAYTVTAARASSLLILEEGVQQQAALGPGEARQYWIYVPGGGRTGVRVALTSLSGTLAMYMDGHNPRPNATGSLWRSEPSVGGATTLEVQADDVSLQACTHPPPHTPSRLRASNRAQVNRAQVNRAQVNPNPNPNPHPTPPHPGSRRAPTPRPSASST